MTFDEKVTCIIAGFCAILLVILWITHILTKKYNKED